jgi:hypothetical protein
MPLGLVVLNQNSCSEHDTPRPAGAHAALIAVPLRISAAGDIAAPLRLLDVP